jgi:hypothetical protein
VEAYLCEAFALWARHECDIRIRPVKVRLGIRGVAGDIGEGRVGRLIWRGKSDGRGLWRNITGTSKRVHEGRRTSVLGVVGGRKAVEPGGGVQILKGGIWKGPTV